MSESFKLDQSITLQGHGASQGIAFGKIVFLQRNNITTNKRYVENTDNEVIRFEKAREEAIHQLGNLYEKSLEKLGERNAFVFQIHQMMLDDPDYVSQIKDKIINEHVNAEYAVEQIGIKFQTLFTSMDNDYMQGRGADVVDISRRINEILSNQSGDLFKAPLISKDDGKAVILATDDLAPSETVSLDQNSVCGVITSKGSARSHTVIFARTLGIPSIISVGDELNKENLDGHYAIIDGSKGLIIIDPTESQKAHYQKIKLQEDALSLKFLKYKGKKTFTKDGRQINLYANIATDADIDLVKNFDAEGIGLFRSEYIYLQSKDFPEEQTQFEIYKDVLERMENKKVIIRTLDIGADKTCDYFMLKKEDNPAMGLRAIRICLTQPKIFKTQLRALYRASMFGNLSIMFPMIISKEEVIECLNICKEVENELRCEKIPFKANIEKGIMIETPAAALISDELAPLVDFFSIGTNDLTQFTLALDRQNADLNAFLDPYHKGVKKLIKMTIENGHKANIWVGLCGELASDRDFAKELIDMGIDELSVSPSTVLMLRASIATL